MRAFNHFISEVTLRPGLNTVAADFWNAWCEQNSGSALAATSSLRVCGDQRRASSRLPASRRSIYAREIVGDALDRSEQR